MRRGSPTSISMLVSTLDTIEAAMASESRFPVERAKLASPEGTVRGVSTGTRDVAGAAVCKLAVWPRDVAAAVLAADSPARVAPLPST